MSELTPERAATALAIGRTIVGAGAWLAPHSSAKALGVRPELRPTLPFVLRLFGVRDAVAGVGYLTADAAGRRQWLTLGIVMDGADAAAALMAGERSGLPRHTRIATAVTALGAVAVALWARQD